MGTDRNRGGDEVNREEAKKWVKLFQAVADGEQLQFYSDSSASWADVRNTPNVGCWPARRYRVKPKPVELEVWYNPNPPGHLRSVIGAGTVSGDYIWKEKGYTKIKVREVQD